MKVDVRLFATLQSYLPAGARGDCASLELPPGATVGDVMASLNIPRDVACLIVVNGHDADPEQVLVAGDELAMFPPLAGGS
jgi:molybdopterin synthase sulfur carrier subunit